MYDLLLLDPKIKYPYENIIHTVCTHDRQIIIVSIAIELNLNWTTVAMAILQK